MIHAAGPLLLVAVLAGLGAYGVLARRNAVMVLVGAELMLNAVALLLVTVDGLTADRVLAGQVLTLFLITVAAAEIGLALAVILLLFRRTGTVDLDQARSLGETARPVGPAPDRDTSPPAAAASEADR